MDPRQRQYILVGLLLAGLLAAMMLFTGLRRLARLRREAQVLWSEHERLFTHAQYRLAAQKHQALAAQTTGAERLEHLRQARALLDQALATRGPGDEDIGRILSDTRAMVDRELAAAQAAAESEAPT